MGGGVPFFPTPFQRFIGLLLLPFTLLYCIIAAYQRISKKTIDLGVPVISVGNLLVGGTGKTPIVIELVKKTPFFCAVVLRGYGRDSKGLFVVSDGSSILEDVSISGDEAALLANALPTSIIIVSENRLQGIEKAKELGAEVVFLDDGYRHHEIKKFDILVRPKKEPTNIMCLPSGGYRDTKMMYAFASMVLNEGEDFKREVYFSFQKEIVEELPMDMVLVSAISKADRLLEYLPQGTPAVFFPDHYIFTKEDMEKLFKKYPKNTIVTTQKDYVKLEKFHLEQIILMELKIEIKEELIQKIQEYIKKH